MFDIQFHSNHDLEPLKQILPKGNYNLGVIYAISWGDRKVKIGKTRRPYDRISSLISYATSYADVEVTRIIVSDTHTNYSDNEKALHKQFADQRVSGEIFSINIDVVKSAIEHLEYHDDSEKLKAVTDKFKDILINFCDPYNIYHDQNSDKVQTDLSVAPTSQQYSKLSQYTDNVIMAESFLRFCHVAFNLIGEEVSQMLQNYANTLPTDCDARKIFDFAADELIPNHKYRVFIMSLGSDNTESDTDNTRDEWLIGYAGNNTDLLKQRDELPDEEWK